MTAPVCAICSGQIAGRHFVTDRGQRYCGHHRRVSACRFCGLIAIDGDKGCEACRQDAVTVDNQLRSASLPVLNWVIANTGAEWFRNVPLAVADLSRLGDRLEGYTNFVAVGSALTAHIQILTGLPQTSVRETLAHEFAHLLLVSRLDGPMYLGGHSLSEPEEEGFCEVIRMLWIQQSGVPDASWRFDSAMAGDDPIYNEGLRQMWPRYLSSDRSILGFRSLVLGLEDEDVHRVQPVKTLDPLLNPSAPRPSVPTTDEGVRAPSSVPQQTPLERPSLPVSAARRPPAGQEVRPVRPVTVTGKPHPPRARPRLRVRTIDSD